MRVMSLLLAGLLWPALAHGEYGWDPASFDIGGYHVLKIRAAAGGMSPAQRRGMLEFRMTKVLTHTQYKKSITVKVQRAPHGCRTILVNDLYFMTVTPVDARACNSTVTSLTNQWAQRIKHVFELVGPARQLPHTYVAEPEAPISLD